MTPLICVKYDDLLEVLELQLSLSITDDQRAQLLKSLTAAKSEYRTSMIFTSSAAFNAIVNAASNESDVKLFIRLLSQAELRYPKLKFRVPRQNTPAYRDFVKASIAANDFYEEFKHVDPAAGKEGYFTKYIELALESMLHPWPADLHKLAIKISEDYRYRVLASEDEDSATTQALYKLYLKHMNNYATTLRLSDIMSKAKSYVDFIKLRYLFERLNISIEKDADRYISEVCTTMYRMEQVALPSTLHSDFGISIWQKTKE
jgi:hypothetical protein